MPTSQTTRGRTTNTFVVRMLDTDDKGWTGVVTHVQSGTTTTFRGLIEVIRFMDGCMDATDVGSSHGSTPTDGGSVNRSPSPDLGPSAVGQGGFT